MSRLDRTQLRMLPLSARHHKLDMAAIAVHPGDTYEPLPPGEANRVRRCAERMVTARGTGSPRMLTYGAHFIKNGLAPLAIHLVNQGWITHVATNGAGSIHDWEFALIGVSTEDVRANTAAGCFGTWEETGRNISLAIASGGVDDLGYGASVGRFIAEDGVTLPSADEIRGLIEVEASAGTASERLGALADLLYLVTQFDLPEGRNEVVHSHPEYSVQHAAWQAGVPFTVHPGIGYDIIYTHPMSCGGAIGRGAVRDFLTYADGVSKLTGGVHLAVGSAIMAPMIFEKALSMGNNLALAEGRETVRDHYLSVVDIQEGGDWDWTQGEPPMDHPAYYLRFCKTFFRMGGTLDYVCLDNRQFMLALCEELAKA